MVHDTPLTLSKSAFATRRGVGVSAVCNWIERGRLSGDALTPDGKINVAVAEEQLGGTLDVSRSLGKQASVEREPGELQLGSGSLAPLGEMAAIKLEQAKRQLQRDREDDLDRRGIYSLTAEMKRAQAREMSKFLTTVETRLPELAGLLDGKRGKEAVTIARRWWRGLRQSESDLAAGRAAGLPAFAVDNAEARHAA